MKDKRIKFLSGVAAVSAIAILAIGLTSGCKSHPAKGTTNVTSPALQPTPPQAEPVQPAALQTAPATLTAQPAASVAPVASPAVPDVKPDTSTYTVQKGDTFSKIARKYGIDMHKLADYNKMSLQKPLKIGVTLKIPQK